MSPDNYFTPYATWSMPIINYGSSTAGSYSIVEWPVSFEVKSEIPEWDE